MNATQRQQWDDYACMSKALIKSASVKGIQLTEDDFCRRYESDFPRPQTHYGGLILSRFYKIAIDIGLGRDMDLFCHHENAKEYFDRGLSVFVVSELHLDPKRCDPFNHTSALLDIDDQSFTVDGYPALPAADWIGKRCCGIVFW
jgi:hypothetical protein